MDPQQLIINNKNIYNKIVDLIINSNFKYDSNIKYKDIIIKKQESIQTGIGDILLNVLLIENNLKNPPLYFNINIYIDNPYQIKNNLNCFEFKLKLLDKICIKDNIIFYYDNNIEYNCEYNLNKITNLKALNKYFHFTNIYDKEYIIFHTKCRFTNNFKYNNLKTQISSFCKNFKSKYQIIILGEKEMAINFEQKYHNITTIYNELLELKQNNNIIDLTIDNIYDNLNFENYCKDMSIIHNAKTNIICGNGGQYCNSIVFGNGMIVYTIPDLNGNFNLNLFERNNNYIYYDINMFFGKIKNI